MSKPRAYVETTIPSFYYEERGEPDIVARREWTQRWWRSAVSRYELVTSPAVLDERTNLTIFAASTYCSGYLCQRW